jgi:hypothetical protein
MIISLLYLHYLGEAVEVADIPVILVVGHVEGRRVARSSDVATRGGGGATQRHSLSTRHPDGAPVLMEENAATVTKLVFLRLITKDRKIIVSLFVGEEEDQAQELAVDAAQGRHACRQESHVPVAAICIMIVADLVGIGALEDAIRVVGVAVSWPSFCPIWPAPMKLWRRVTSTSKSVCAPRGCCGFRDRRGGCPHS